ncbi:MAG: EAL domain-containing protein [Actinomycetota bacterium]
MSVALAATGLLAVDRNNEFAALQSQYDDAARSQFSLEIESATQHVHREIDRLTELISGVQAFAVTGPAAPWVAVDRYLALTDAATRFPALSDAVVQRTPVGAGTPTVTPELSALLDEIATAVGPTPAEPTLSSHTYDGGETIAISFGLPIGSGETLASLIFRSDAFLDRAMVPNPRINSTMTNTGEPTATSTLQVSELVLVESGDDYRLVARTPIDVFGTVFEVRSESTTDLLSEVDRSLLWLLLGAGAAAAFGLYAALRSLFESRASAWESARTADRQRAAMASRFRASFDLAPIGMAELDTDGRIIEVNGALCDQAGQDRERILGEVLSALVHESDRDAHIARVGSLVAGRSDAVQGEHRYRGDDGNDVWVHESISVVRSEHGEPRTLLVQSQDITAQRRAAWELAQQALHDELTGLPNRALFLNRLKHALIRAERHESQVAVMFIDIDRFKVINDSLGHETGDEFLVQIAARLGRAVRAGDTVARFGGDEFVVLCENVSGVSEATAAAQRIQGSFAEPFGLAESPTYASASIGITLSGSADTSADSLLRDADAAMYRAKEGGRNRFEVFDQTMRSSIVARMEIESQLREALQNGEIVMHYQAIVDPHTHEPAGYEALIRWNHPEKGLLGPGAFLSVAEDAGLIDLIDSFALRSVCHQIADWTSTFPAARNLYLTTNWSARNLGRFVHQVEAVLTETGINPQQLVIEVTEGFLLEDSDASVLALQRLKQLGVQIAIDDFGTGYSSLAYLTQFAVDYLKIDQSFVSKLPEDEASAAVIGAIADMAGRLGIKLVAEGVETDEQIEMLTSLGSPRLQGYRFAKPRPAADIEYHLAQRSGLLETMVRDAESLLTTRDRSAVGAAGT